MAQRFESKLDRILANQSATATASSPVPVPSSYAPPLSDSSKALELTSAHDVPSTSGTSYHEYIPEVLPGEETDDSSTSTTDEEDDPHLGDQFSREFVSNVA